VAALDLLTRKGWRLLGREIDLDGEHAWLRAPVSTDATVADGWIEAEARLHGGSAERASSGGLLVALAGLDGPGFTAASLRAEVRDFYTHTARWRMEVWSGWSPAFWPGGELISRLFGRRVQQLALPMRPLDVAHGMDSDVVLIRDRHGEQVSAAWLRRLRSTGEYVYSGCYSMRRLPDADRPSVHVAFPLENGNVQVFLRPTVGGDGELLLESPPGRFGADGAYVVVHDRGRTFASRAPVHESFRVYVDEDGVLRTDHQLRMWSAQVLRLHYRLEPRPENA